MLARHGGKIKFDRCTDTTGYFLGNRAYRRELAIKECNDDPVRPNGPISLVKSQFSVCVYQEGAEGLRTLYDNLAGLAGDRNDSARPIAP